MAGISKTVGKYLVENTDIIKILYIFTNSDFRSVNNEKWFEMLRSFKGAEITILVPEKSEQENEAFKEEYSSYFNILFFKELQELKRMSYWGRLRYIKTIAREIDDFNPAIVHIQGCFYTYMIFPLFFIHGNSRIIYNIWGSDFSVGYFSKLKNRVIIRWLFKKAALIWTNWFSMADMVKTEFPRYQTKIRTITWGADRSLFVRATESARKKVVDTFAFQPDQFIMLYARSFTQNSNHETLLNALKNVDANLNYKLILHYQGASEDAVSRLNSIIKQNQLVDKVVISGYRFSNDEMKALYEIADLTFSLAIKDQLSRTVFEAILSDTHLIVSDIPSHRYLKDIYGFSVEITDVFDSKKLGKLIDDYIKNRPQVNWEREKTIIQKKFNFGAKREEYLSVYRSLLNNS